jgi:DNA-binding transcriptional LysR family regulator
MIDLRTIKYALAVAEHRGFRKAAEALYLTQPTLTRAIRDLEESLGTKIFDRGRRTVEPTPLGRIFLTRAEEVLQAAADLKREIDLVRGLEIGRLEIGSGVGPADLHMGTTVGRLSQSYPHLNIQVEVNDYAVLTHLLQSGRIELFVAETSEVELVPDFLVTPLNVLKCYLFCRRGHPLLDRPSQLTLREALEYPLVMTKLPRRVLDSIAETCGFQKYPDWLEKLPIIKCDYVKLGKEAVAASNAVAFILLPMIERELRSGEFVLLPVDFPELKTHYGIVQRRERTLSPVAEVFITLLHEVDAELARVDQELRRSFGYSGKGKLPRANKPGSHKRS